MKNRPRHSGKPRKLGDYLLESDLITAEQLQQALESQTSSDKKLGDIIVDMGFLTLGEMSMVLSRQMKDGYFPAKSRFGDLLVESGIITEEQLEEALRLQEGKPGQKDKPEKIGKILETLAYVRKDEITEAISRKLNIPIISCAEHRISDALLKLIPQDVALKQLVLPLEKVGGLLVLAMSNPLDYQAIDDLKFRTGMKILPVIAYEWAILKAIENNYRKDEDDEIIHILDGNIAAVREVIFDEDNSIAVDDELTIESMYTKSKYGPIVNLVAMLVARAGTLRASDLHIEPGEKFVQVRFRIDGEMRNMFKFQKEFHPAVVSRIKIMSGLDIANRRTPQDGSAHVSFKGRGIDLRISTLPSIFGEQIVIRLLDQETGMISMDELGMPSTICEALARTLAAPQGMLMVTGPTGSGKSTTLYASIRQINSGSKKIITIEDPVEYTLKGITQMQVNEKMGRTFSNILRSVLRHDPDVIMVGEIRDMETAEIAMKAALTGHLVLSTLHTNSTISTITRLVDMGVPRYLLASSISGILAQRLVRRICPHCKILDAVPADKIEVLKSLGLPVIEKHYYGTGCRECSDTGYSGRIAVYEYLGLTRELKKILAQTMDETVLKAAALKEGFTFLIDDVWDKVTRGVTTLDEVFSKIPVEHTSPSLQDNSELMTEDDYIRGNTGSGFTFN